MPRVWLVFNQPKYVPGDTAFFSGFITNNLPSSTVLNIRLIDPNGSTVVRARGMFLKGQCSGQLFLPEDLVDGVYKLTSYFEGWSETPSVAFESKFIIAGEKLFDLSGRSAASLEDQAISECVLTLSGEEVAPRGKITAQLRFPRHSAASVTVVHDDLYQNQIQPWLTDLTRQGDHVNDKQVDISAYETRFFFRGNVEIDSSSANLPDSLLITFYFSKNDFTYRFYAKPDGYFEFPMLKPFRDEEVFYVVSRKGVDLKNARIKLRDVAPPVTNDFSQAMTDEVNKYYSLSSEKERIEWSYKYYGPGQVRQTSTYEFDEIWREADRVVDLEKFEPFATMEEVLSNIVQSAKTRGRDGSKGVRIFMKETALFADDDPIYFINGRMTEDTRLFLDLDPSKITKIGILRSERNLSQFGQLGINGALLVKTSEDLPGLENCTRCLTIIGISKQLPFYHPVYSATKQRSSRVPDLRSNLYWNPKLELDDRGQAEFSFYTSDIPGKYHIVVRGVTTDRGDVIYKQASFEVKNKKSP